MKNEKNKLDVQYQIHLPRNAKKQALSFKSFPNKNLGNPKSEIDSATTTILRNISTPIRLLQQRGWLGWNRCLIASTTLKYNKLRTDKLLWNCFIKESTINPTCLIILTLKK
jgi:hypothetical protein